MRGRPYHAMANSVKLLNSSWRRAGTYWKRYAVESSPLLRAILDGLTRNRREGMFDRRSRFNGTVRRTPVDQVTWKAAGRMVARTLDAEGAITGFDNR